MHTSLMPPMEIHKQFCVIIWDAGCQQRIFFKEGLGRTLDTA